MGKEHRGRQKIVVAPLMVIPALRCSSNQNTWGFAPHHRPSTLISPSTSLLSPWHRVIILSTRIHRRHGWQPTGKPRLTGGPQVTFFGPERATTPTAEEKFESRRSPFNWSTKWLLKCLRSCNKNLLKERAIIYRSS